MIIKLRPGARIYYRNLARPQVSGSVNYVINYTNVNEMDKRVCKNVFLSFKLGNELFAVSVKKVLEVLQKQPVTLIPETPDYIRGIINFRGDIVTVADTRKRFKLPPQEENQKFVIIILELKFNQKDILVGTTADAVNDVIEIAEDEIKMLSDSGSHINTEFISGIVQRGDKFIMVLDVDKVYSFKDMTQFASAICD